ncbi:unnamed protein product [Macrosiphum euphorbiae]|uniref:Transposase domain-containing protein n=1 Tax=Macrosiphum euphorbiae TaxID=13131 RepID=A0AAV0YA97_9HEMI|nr:unnamed protein product [Macrosiphum euphorbiae]
MSSNRSKRRKIKKELDLISNIYSKNEPVISIETDSCENEITESIDYHSPKTTNLNSDPQIVDSSYENTVTHIQENLNVIGKQQIPLLSVIVENKLNNNFEKDLAVWAVDCNVPQSTVNSLLHLMKMYDNINTKTLPRDCSTLLATPRLSGTKLRYVASGEYYHFGLTAGIQRFASPGFSDIHLFISVDGLPLTKNTNSQFWPILAYIVGTSKIVFPVGIYHGFTKPKDSDEFLSDFIVKAKDLLSNGIIINGVNRKVFIKGFVCDSPAKSFLLKTKGHSGFSSYNRCTIEGEYFQNRVCFPYSRNKCPKRTHESYAQMMYEDYHIGGSISRLIELPGLNLVQSFSLDYMHLVLIGVTRKLVLLWLNKGPLHVRLPSRSAHKLTASLLALKKYIPSDFSRKPREIQGIGRWKATELRLFLLYIGPIVLEGVINKDCYDHFMILHVAMIILLSPTRQCYLDYAEQMLDYFVEKFENLYGHHHVSHNVHGILHLCDDYQHFGPLDNCSAFVFENYMKNLKSKVRKNEKPLEQLINRYSEIYIQHPHNTK